MKIQCEVCEVAEGEVLCCADEAVLCLGCDEKVHAANKLSQKHQRVSLIKHPSSLSCLPLCDVCQVNNGYFFCLEDRAILCRECDLSTHLAPPSSHQRFLIGGIKVALESSANNTHSGLMQSLTYSNSSLSSIPTIHQDSKAALTLDIVTTNLTEATATSAESQLTNTASWSLDDILGTDHLSAREFSDK